MEEEAIRQAQSGDHSAFRKLVEAHSEMAWRVARTLLENSLAAEDAVQDAWLDVWRGLAHFDNTRPFRPWLLTIVANRCRMTRRRRTLPTTSISETVHPDGLFEDLEIGRASCRERVEVAVGDGEVKKKRRKGV